MYLRKLSDDERPLRLRLCVGPNEKLLSFVIKENETGEVNVSVALAYEQIQTTHQPSQTHIEYARHTHYI